MYKLDELESVKANMKAELNAQRRLVSELQSEKTNKIGDRGELEGIFLDCVEQVRQEIKKRKTLQQHSESGSLYADNRAAKSFGK